MSYTTSFMPVPLPSGPTIDASGTTQWNSAFSHHGSLEQPVGGWQSVSQPQTPRSARSISGHRDRSRDRSPRRSDESDHEPSQGWGPRIISLEQKVADLQSQINGASLQSLPVPKGVSMPLMQRCRSDLQTLNRGRWSSLIL